MGLPMRIQACWGNVSAAALFVDWGNPPKGLEMGPEVGAVCPWIGAVSILGCFAPTPQQEGWDCTASDTSLHQLLSKREGGVSRFSSIATFLSK